MSVLSHDKPPHLYARMIAGVGVDIALVDPLPSGALRETLSDDAFMTWIREGNPREMMLDLTSLASVLLDDVTWLVTTHAPKVSATGVRYLAIVAPYPILQRVGTSFRDVAALHRHVETAFFDEQAPAVRWLANRSFGRAWPPSLQEISESVSKGDRTTAMTMLRALQGFTLSSAEPALDAMAAPALHGVSGAVLTPAGSRSS